MLAAVPSQSPGLFWIWPFAAILLCLAILPLVRRTADWWHHNRNKLLVAIGFACSFVAGYFVVKTFLDYVSRHGFALFAWWRVIVGSIGLVLLAIGF